MFDLSPLHHVLNWQVFYIYIKYMSDRHNVWILFVNGDDVWRTDAYITYVSVSSVPVSSEHHSVISSTSTHFAGIITAAVTGLSYFLQHSKSGIVHRIVCLPVCDP